MIELIALPGAVQIVDDDDKIHQHDEEIQQHDEVGLHDELHASASAVQLIGHDEFISTMRMMVFMMHLMPLPVRCSSLVMMNSSAR